MDPSNLKTIEISSDSWDPNDSSSDTSSGGWGGYFPPGYSSITRNKTLREATLKQWLAAYDLSGKEPDNEKPKTSRPTPPSDVDDKSAKEEDPSKNDEETFPSKTVPSLSSGSVLRPPPSSVVLALPSPKAWNQFGGRGAKKTIPDFMGKGKQKV
jgi:hypothetical protein